MTLGDRDLVSGLRSGASDGLASLIDTYGADVRAIAFSICRDDDAAEDVAAETFAIAWRKVASLRSSDRLRPWLLRIATRQALQILRNRPRPPHLDEASIDLHVHQQGFEPSSDTRLDLSAAMFQLPPRTRAVIALRYVSDLSVDEISIVTGRSRNTIKTELRLGLRKLRELVPNL
jgi:RNA polymerase sigma-70 factor (ECF subfamily)